MIVTGARAPIALHLARLFREAGIVPVLADAPRFPMSLAMRGVAYERTPAPVDGLDAYAAAWRRLTETHRPAMIVPTCEDVIHLAAARDVAGVDMPLFAPPLGALIAAHDKWSFSRSSLGLGADPPRTTRLSNREAVEALGDCRDLVLKPVWSRFGSRTLMAPDAQALRGLVPSEEDPWIAQEAMTGEETCATAVAQGGRVHAMKAYRPTWRAGLGAGIAFEPVEDDDLAAFVAGFCLRTGWTGQVSFDFRRDAGGRHRVIECNPRPTSGLHFFGPEDDLPGAYLHGRGASASRRRGMTLRLAMVTYGLRQAVGQGDVARWARDLRAMEDIARWPGEGSGIPSQLRAFVEMTAKALVSRRGLRAASTEDIEWNGKPFLSQQRAGPDLTGT